MNTNIRSLNRAIGYESNAVARRCLQLLSALLADSKSDIDVAALDNKITDANFVRLRRAMYRVACADLSGNSGRNCRQESKRGRNIGNAISRRPTPVSWNLRKYPAWMPLLLVRVISMLIRTQNSIDGERECWWEQCQPRVRLNAAIGLHY
jgi:hypothetical protein